MTRRATRLRAGLCAIAALALGVAACASSSPTAAPTLDPTASPTPVASAPPPPTSVPFPSVPAGAVCPVMPSEGLVPSDRLVDLRVDSTAAADRITFVFGEPSLGGAPGSARGALREAVPPFTHGDMPFELRGERFLSVSFTGMSISDDVGQEVYRGPRDVAPGLPSLRHVVMPGPFEGIIGFYVGYDGGGCVELGQDGNEVTLTIARQ